MFKVTEQQLDDFSAEMHSAFRRSMMGHAKEFSPKLAVLLGDDQLGLVIDAALDRANEHGFTFRGPLRQFVELSFLFGTGFANDVQYPWIREALGEPNAETQMARAEVLHEKCRKAIDAIHGPGLGNTLDSLQCLREFADTDPSLAGADLSDLLVAEMKRIHPQKVEFVGEPALRVLIEDGLGLADRHEFSTPRARALLPIIMFAFGQSCAADPLYPWIEKTLTDERIVKPAARAARLEKKALVWLDRVLANREEGVPT